eukprot:5095391-Lingulodinium_polyedra.AAC.1
MADLEEQLALGSVHVHGPVEPALPSCCCCQLQVPDLCCQSAQPFQGLHGSLAISGSAPLED